MVLDQTNCGDRTEKRGVTCTQTHTHTNPSTRTHTHTHTHTQTQAHEHTHTNPSTHTHKPKHTNTHTQTHKHTNTHKRITVSHRVLPDELLKLEHNPLARHNRRSAPFLESVLGGIDCSRHFDLSTLRHPGYDFLGGLSTQHATQRG